jgi:hypothetical protein
VNRPLFFGDPLYPSPLTDISPSILTTLRRASGCIVSMSNDVGRVVAMSVAVAEQLGGDRVAAGLVVDQYAAEGVAGGRSKGQKQLADVLFLGHGRAFAAT